MTASEMIESAACKVGLAVPGRVPAQVSVYGLAALNRVYRWVWQQFPYREQRIIDLAVPVVATEAILVFPWELDVVRSVYLFDRALYPIHETTEMRQGSVWRSMPPGQPLRTVDLPDGTDGDGRAVRRVKLVPPSEFDATAYVSGLRRFTELAAGDTPLLTRCENVLFDYLAAEFFEFDDQQERADKERSKAGDELESAINWQETIEDTDTSATPTDSFMAE